MVVPAAGGEAAVLLLTIVKIPLLFTINAFEAPLPVRVDVPEPDVNTASPFIVTLPPTLIFIADANDKVADVMVKFPAIEFAAPKLLEPPELASVTARFW